MDRKGYTGVEALGRMQIMTWMTRKWTVHVHTFDDI